MPATPLAREGYTVADSGNPPPSHDIVDRETGKANDEGEVVGCQA
jgi:hypothetical protein